MANSLSNEYKEKSTTNWPFYSFVIASMIMTLLISYWETYYSIVTIWERSGTFAHGFVIIPISLYLIWQKRHLLEQLEPEIFPPAFVLFIGLVFIWLVSSLIDIDIIKQLSAVGMIPVLTWAILGSSVARAILFPLTYLIFAVPMGEFLVPVLQDFTAVFTVISLQLFGFPVYMEGRLFHIPSGSFEVAEACSGIRYLIASIALGVLYAYYFYQSAYRRIAFILLAAVVPIVANGLRAFSIVLLAHFTDNEFGKGVDHIVYGWLFFGLVMLFLFWFGALFIDKPMDSKKTSNEELDNFSQCTGNDKLRNINNKPPALSKLKTTIFICITAITLISGPVFSKWLKSKNMVIESSPIEPPIAENNWTGPLPADDSWNPSFQGAESQYKVAYQKDGKQVQLYVAYYLNQSQGAELINSENRLYNGEKWKIVSDQPLEIQLKEHKKWKVQSEEVMYAGKKRTIWSWYKINSDNTTNPKVAKLLEAKNRLFMRTGGSSIVAVSTTTIDAEQSAKPVLLDFVNSMLSVINYSLDEVKTR